MKDPICKRDGCYMFAAATPERAGCEKACRLSGRYLAAANDPRELSGRLTTDTGRFTPHLVRSDYDRSISEVLRGKTRKVGEVAEGAAKLGSFGIDYAALEMRVMANLMNKKEGE